MIKKSKYYYDYTRNMNNEQMENKKVNCDCERNLVACACIMADAVQNKIKETKLDDDKFFEAWCKSLEEQEQPTCNIDNPEDCENCGS